jgi:hypothetical protein
MLSKSSSQVSSLIGKGISKGVFGMDLSKAKHMKKEPQSSLPVLKSRYASSSNVLPDRVVVNKISEDGKFLSSMNPTKFFYQFCIPQFALKHVLIAPVSGLI